MYNRKLYVLSILCFVSVALKLNTVVMNTKIQTNNKRIVVGGATGYIGRAVVKDLVSRGIETYALVRSKSSISDITNLYLEGSNIIECDVLNEIETTSILLELEPESIINCLASRNGLKDDSYTVDYGGGANLLRALHTLSIKSATPCHYVMLSAFCCGKPQLHFQHAKLKLEKEIQELSTSDLLTYSILRPTAYFKSLDGQVEAAKKGNPILYFGSGECAANAISEEDLASVLSDCAIDAQAAGMLDTIRNIGGPDIPPISKKQQIELIFDALDIPIEKRRAISLPIGIFNNLISLFSNIEFVSRKFGFENIATKCEDASEIVKIVRYYATEPMIATGQGEVHGRIQLRDHFCNIAGRGGCLIEIDRYTTTTGVIDLVLKNDYVK